MDISLVKGQEEQVRKRLEACGNCNHPVVVDFIEQNNREVPVYKCGALNCRKTLDTKIVLKEQQCPMNKW